MYTSEVHYLSEKVAKVSAILNWSFAKPSSKTVRGLIYRLIPYITESESLTLRAVQRSGKGFSCSAQISNHIKLLTDDVFTV